MVKYCLNCGAENFEDAFQCKRCNSKFVDYYAINQEISGEEYRKQFIEHQDTYKSFNYYENRAIKIFIVAFVIFIVFVIIFIYFGNSKGSYFSWTNCKFNEDFWFEEDKIITDEGWIFTLDKVKDYTINGIVLALNTYSRYDTPYDPCNIFSPIDLCIGVDDIKDNTNKYDYSITSFHNRKVCWYLYYDDIAEYQYFKSHTGNNHLIPHNEDVLKMLQNISVKDIVLIRGSLVNLYGSRGKETYIWTTDKYIGNFKCEVILVDELTIL